MNGIMNILNEESIDGSTFIITFYFTIHIPKTLIKNQATTEKCRPATFTPTIRSVEKWCLQSCVRVISRRCWLQPYRLSILFWTLKYPPPPHANNQHAVLLSKSSRKFKYRKNCSAKILKFVCERERQPGCVCVCVRAESTLPVVHLAASTFLLLIL